MFHLYALLILCRSEMGRSCGRVVPGDSYCCYTMTLVRVGDDGSSRGGSDTLSHGCLLLVLNDSVHIYIL